MKEYTVEKNEDIVHGDIIEVYDEDIKVIYWVANDNEEFLNDYRRS